VTSELEIQSWQYSAWPDQGVLGRSAPDLDRFPWDDMPALAFVVPFLLDAQCPGESGPSEL
jgi:hypothetical protein